MQVEKWNYGNYSSTNYGTNTIAVEMGPLTFYFSYDTIVAYRSPQDGMVMSENVWGPTTGKHLRIIGGNGERLPREEFKAKVAKLTDTLARALTGTIGYIESDTGVIVNK